jgi:hypothetical protein
MALVTVVLATHFLYLGFVVFGGFAAWRWPRMFWVHLITVVWGVLVISFPLMCPLTAAENWARERTGYAPTDRGFIDRYIEGVIYPPQYVQWVRLAVALVIAYSWWGAWRGYKKRRAGVPSPESESPTLTV